MHIIEQQGSVFQVKNPTFKPQPNTEPAKRGKVETFSTASRRRLIDFLARMDDNYKRSTFITLTFHEPPSNEAAYAALKRFLQRVRTWFPEASAVWRKEPQERGAIHFHLIAFNLPYWPQYHLQDTWTECTDEIVSIAHIKLIRKFSTYMSYISKYIAKADSSPVEPSLVVGSYQQKPIPRIVGRVWGYFNKKALPLAPLLKIVINDEELGRYAFWSCMAMSRGRCGDSLYSRKSYTVEAKQMLAFVVQTAERIYAEPDEIYHEEMTRRKGRGTRAFSTFADQ
jgi:hypothetical protein